VFLYGSETWQVNKVVTSSSKFVTQSTSFRDRKARESSDSFKKTKEVFHRPNKTEQPGPEKRSITTKKKATA
jgi:hypothetical protein